MRKQKPLIRRTIGRRIGDGFHCPLNRRTIPRQKEEISNSQDFVSPTLEIARKAYASIYGSRRIAKEGARAHCPAKQEDNLLRPRSRGGRMHIPSKQEDNRLIANNY
jgi:hypothetical protein